MVEIAWSWLILWLFAFAALGFGTGWAFKGLMTELRECRWCNAPTETPQADYCRHHGAELRARLRAEEEENR